ncbi:MAG TPA: thioredoxin [Nannocystaceae bacterium]|nr:thioredoxin [Nannocystaceae bacterium]
MSESISHVTDSSFKADVLDSPAPVLVDFWAVWCGPCRAIAPHLESLAGELGEKVRIVKVNVDENQQTAMNYQIRSIPTLLMFKGGKVVDQMVGNPGSKAKLAEFINRHV